MSQSSLMRAQTMLIAAYPDDDPGTLLDWSIGRRSAALLEVRRATFGPGLNARADCAVCGEQLELTLDSNDILLSAPQNAPEAAMEFSNGDYEITYRLPTGRDLLVVARCKDIASARMLLLERCIISAFWQGDTLRVTDLPDDLVDELTGCMESDDPLANITLGLSCPACGHEWMARLDIADFIWTEIEAEARRLLYDVHRLAKAYHWHESNILTMSRLRRQTYLNLIGGD